jgi:hypothetical protein
MAETRGVVQRLKITPGAFRAWAYIGPSPTNTTLLLVPSGAAGDAADIAAHASMADALSAALVSRRAVKAVHGDDNATITQIEFEAE